MHPHEVSGAVTTILIVEDNRIDAHLTSHALNKIRGWPIMIQLVDDGDKAIKFLRREGEYAGAPTPDLIILDMNLPKRDGTEVLQFIRSEPLLRGIPVYIFSSSPVEIAKESAKMANVAADRYFEKPYEFGSYYSIGLEMQQAYVSATGNRHTASA